ncbi:MAG: hypothetical protein GY940_14010, partial [bacterium]|nr:hypothetical protein [bacterium]
MFLTRAPVKTVAHAEAFVEKTLRYEKNPAQNNFINKFALTGVLLWTPGDAA